MTLLAKLMKRVSPEPNSGCWLWLGHANRDGYATFGAIHSSKLAHRLLYEEARGPIPKGKQLDHLCRVRCCVNPQHLEIVDTHENTRRGVLARIHCPAGHPYVESNLYHFNDKWRHCRQCTLLRVKRYSQSRKNQSKSP